MSGIAVEHALVLVRAEAAMVADWVRKGIVPSYVVPSDHWTAVVPAGPARGPAPYVSGPDVLLNRPLPVRTKPSIALATGGGHAFVAVQPGGWRPILRWVTWAPGVGASRLGSLPLATPSDIATVSGVDAQAGVPFISTMLRDASGDALALLTQLAGALHLPYAEVLTGVSASTLPLAELVTPGGRGIGRFAKVVHDEDEIRRDEEKLS